MTTQPVKRETLPDHAYNLEAAGRYFERLQDEYPDLETCTRYLDHLEAIKGALEALGELVRTLHEEFMIEDVDDLRSTIKSAEYLWEDLDNAQAMRYDFPEWLNTALFDSQFLAVMVQ